MATSPEESERSVTEVVIRTFATQIFALANYGHSGSLLNLPTNLHVGYTITFLLYPSIITGQIALGLLEAVRYRIREARNGINDASFTFYLHGILGVHVAPSPIVIRENDSNGNDPVLLFHVGHSLVQRTTCRMTWKHFGRILVCTAVIVQAIGTTILFVRRFHQDHQLLVLDIFNGLAAFCSTITGFGSLIVLLSRYEWTVVREIQPIRERNKEWANFLIILSASTIGFLWSGTLMGFYFYWWLVGVLCGRGLFEKCIVAFSIIIFRDDIRRRLGLVGGYFARALTVLFAIGMFWDVVMLLIIGIWQVREDGGGWKDPWSDRLLVV